MKTAFRDGIVNRLRIRRRINKLAKSFGNFSSACLNVTAVDPLQPKLHPQAGKQQETCDFYCIYHFKFSNRRAASSALARLLKALTRKKPSPDLPNPLPGVITMLASFKMRSNACQLVTPEGA